jgi:hypothetical protein
MKTLIIYELIPEETKTYVVDLTPEEFARYSKLAGKFVNYGEFTDEETEIADELSERLSDDYDGRQPGAYAQFEVKGAADLLKVSVEAVILTGFGL